MKDLSTDSSLESRLLEKSRTDKRKSPSKYRSLKNRPKLRLRCLKVKVGRESDKLIRVLIWKGFIFNFVFRLIKIYSGSFYFKKKMRKEVFYKDLCIF